MKVKDIKQALEVMDPEADIKNLGMSMNHLLLLADSIRGYKKNDGSKIKVEVIDNPCPKCSAKTRGRAMDLTILAVKTTACSECNYWEVVESFNGIVRKISMAFEAFKIRWKKNNE